MSIILGPARRINQSYKCYLLQYFINQNSLGINQNIFDFLTDCEKINWLQCNHDTYNISFRKVVKFSKLYKDIKNYRFLYTCITRLTISEKINILPPNLSELYIENNYDYVLPSCLPKRLQKIVIKGIYRHYLPEDLPNSLEELYLGPSYYFNLPKNLSNLRLLHLGDTFNLPLHTSSLTNLLILYIGKYNEYIEYLPNSLQKLFIGPFYNHTLPSLPPTLRELYLDDDYNHRILNSLPDTLSILDLGLSYSHKLPTPLPSNLIELRIQDNYNHQLPDLSHTKLQKLWVGKYYKHIISIPSSLRFLYAPNCIQLSGERIHELIITILNT